MPLEDYKGIVGAAASVVTIAQIFSGVFVCKDIVRKGNTKNVQSAPFIGGIGLSVLFFKYADLINDPGMYPVNIVGAVLNIAYLSCFYIYTNEKTDVIKGILKASVFFGSILLYINLENPELVLFRFGIITTVLMLLLVASPLAQLGEVIRTESTECLPFPMILMGTISAFCWLLYGIILSDAFIQIQNLVAFLLSVAQLSLFVIYPSKPVSEKKKN
ncbi:sugar transporter SWEET1 [Frankliniella occidentalis]|uniref:Sugar transporter SWEET1 n=1 Tax=Frankliniella occidentalis TaxID=133901 RepID=A0A6J1S7M8_FRAOC|nr:sugar transporter SWEET1 [Frankliniella occidentalis]